MPTLTIGDKSVTVGDEFLKLSPEQQNSTVDEIAKSMGVASQAKAAPDAAPAAAPSPSIWDAIKTQAGNAGQAADDVVRLIANGATFGQADKLAAKGNELLGIDSNPLKLSDLVTGNNAGSVYERNAAVEAGKTTEARDRAGLAGKFAEFGGSMFPAGQIAKGVGLAANGIEALPMLGRIAANPFVQAGATGGIYGGTDAELNGRDPLTGAAIGAASGVVGQGVANAVSGVVGRAAGAFNKKPELPDAAAIKQAAGDAYKASESAGVILKPDAMQRLTGDIKTELADKGFLPKLQPKVAAALEELDRVSADNVTLKGLDVLRRVANAAKTDIDPSTKMMGAKMVEKIDDFTKNLNATDIIPGGNKTEGVKALFEARKNWQMVRKGEMIDEAMEKAANNAMATGSGGNIDNAIRQQFKSILNDPKKRGGFSQDEMQAMRKIVQGDAFQNAMRLAGKLAPQGNGLMLTMQVAGGAASGGATLPLAALGSGAKKIADAMTPNNVEQLSRVVRAGGSAAAANPAPNTVQKFAESERDALARLLMSMGVSGAGAAGFQ